MANKALFLDRDGTIIEHIHHLVKKEDIKLIPEMLEVMKCAAQKGYLLIIVTNQSVVARGYLNEEELNDLHAYLLCELKNNGIQIDAVYYCPHHVTDGINNYKIDCDCRKPKPGLLIRAANDFNINLAQSIMVGDNITDIEAGIKAGCFTFLIENNNYQDIKVILK